MSFLPMHTASFITFLQQGFASLLFTAPQDVLICSTTPQRKNWQPENLLDYVSILQEELVRSEVLPADYDFEGHRELVGMQAGDVPITYADSDALERDYGFTPKIGIREGLRSFAEWYKDYYAGCIDKKAEE